jgi:hypothetical protein
LKPFFPAVIALVLGIVLGAWQPRGELLEMRTELDAMKTAGGKPCRASAADSLRDLLRAPGGAVDDSRRVRNAAPAGAPTDEGVATGGATVEGGELDPNAPSVPVSDADAFEQGQEAMSAALDARRAQALAALTEQADLEEEDVAAVNAAMKQMNDELGAQIDAMVTSAVSDGELDRRDMMEFGAEALDVVLAADDRMRDIIPPEVYAQIDASAVDPLSYISGETLDTVARLKDVKGPDWGPE